MNDTNPIYVSCIVIIYLKQLKAWNRNAAGIATCFDTAWYVFSSVVSLSSLGWIVSCTQGGYISEFKSRHLMSILNDKPVSILLLPGVLPRRIVFIRQHSDTVSDTIRVFLVSFLLGKWTGKMWYLLMMRVTTKLDFVKLITLFSRFEVRKVCNTFPRPKRLIILPYK